MYEQKKINTYKYDKSYKTINENIYNNEIINKNNKSNKTLKRPLSSLNIMAVKLNNIKNNDNNFENLNNNKNNKIILNNNDKFDLDLMFEKQLQKLREINREYESNDKEINNPLKYDDITNSFEGINRNTIKLNDNKIKNKNDNNEINQNSDNNKKIITYNILPLTSNLQNNKSLPKISSPKYNNRIIFQLEENKLNNANNLFINKDSSKSRPFSSKVRNYLHKDFGKIPKYLQEMKIKAEILKDIQNKKKEEEKYPKGTRLLSEEERFLTLKKLKESKKELENLLEKLPITLNSLSSRKKQQKLIKELDEIEQAIETFSKNKVFVKIDS